MGTRVLSEWKKWLRHETDQSLSASAEVKNEWSYISMPPICLHDVDRGNFTFTQFFILYFQITVFHDYQGYITNQNAWTTTGVTIKSKMYPIL